MWAELGAGRGQRGDAEAGMGRTCRGHPGLTVPIWGASRAVSNLGRGCIKIKITWCHSVPSTCSQVRKRQSCRGSHSMRMTSPLALSPLSRAAPGLRGAQGGRAGCGVGLGVWSAMRVPHRCHGGVEQWPWARGAACTQLRSFCGGTSFDINIFLLSTRPTFQTMPLASRLPHSSSAILPQPALRWHLCQHGTPAMEG